MPEQNGTGLAGRTASMFVNAMVLDRQRLARQLGNQFDGHRNVFDAAGYGIEITPNEYKGRYERHDIASRVVDAPAEETWRHPPEIRDGVDWDKAQQETEFTRAWQEFTSIDKASLDLQDRKTVWHYLQRADRLAGVGRFGCLLLGFNDGDDLDQPLRRNAVAGPAGFLYFSAFDETDIVIKTMDQDPTSSRYGLPEIYQLDMGTDVGSGAKVIGTTLVHWTRVVHIAEDLQADEVFGVPRLRPVWNRLIDLEKIMAGSGEAAWRLMFKGIVASTRDGYTLADDEVTQDKISAYVHGYQRFLELEGMEITEMGGEVVDPSGVAKLNVAFISAATSIPQRILLGSERGELASTQDEENWQRVIETRQELYAEPIILRPTINRLIYAGVLPLPSTGSYVAKWLPMHEDDEGEKATTAKTTAEALNKMAAATGETIALVDFLKEYIPRLADYATIEVKVPVLPQPEEEEEEDGDTETESEVKAASAAGFRPYP